MHYTQDISSCFAGKVGKAGLDERGYKALHDKAGTALNRLHSPASDNLRALLALPTDEGDIEAITTLAEQIRVSASHLLVLGTGGSSLGGMFLTGLADGTRQGPEIRFLDNVDPHTMDQLLATLPMDKVFLLIISKSGSTVETLSQALICMKAMREKERGEESLAQHAAVITMPGDSPLQRLAQRWKLPVIDHPPDIGGRFAVLTAVGLVPAAVGGLDVKALRKGAANCAEQMQGAQHAADVPPLVGAMVAMQAMGQSLKQSVMLPYCDRLELFGAWYRQLWAESLGKQGHGSTPIRALGTVDQHSQLQLYLDGPKDKLFTLISLDHAGKGPAIDLSLLGDERMDYLDGHSIGDVMQAEQQATLETLTHNGCPVRHIHIPELTEQAIGALLMHFMLETIATADMLGINPFDQPAVEDGKRRTRAFLEASQPALMEG